MTPAPAHQARVFGSPWEGVYGTHMDSARHFGKHWHAVYGLGVMEAGAQSSASGRGQVDAYAGDLITTNPGEVHDGHPIGGPTRRWRMLYLAPMVMASMVGDALPVSPREVALTRPVIQDAALSQALQTLLRRLGQWNGARASASADALACEESLVRTCALLLQHHVAAAPLVSASEPVRLVRERLADDPLAPPSLTELARMTGLSKYQVLRRFEQAYGVTPHAWLLQQRAERARTLIRGGANLAEAALACGFADQSHMTRIFTRQFGFTPGVWQRAAALSTRT